MAWFKPITLEQVQARSAGTMMEHLGIEFTELGAEHIAAKMPVDSRTRQPEGLLHGGASVVLAESLASTAANLMVDHEKQYCVGLEINANHLRSVRDGYVVGVSTPIHIGKATQVWETRISQDGKLICVSRMTAAVLNRRAP